jgi:hypothetical protein
VKLSVEARKLVEEEKDALFKCSVIVYPGNSTEEIRAILETDLTPQVGCGI